MRKFVTLRRRRRDGMPLVSGVSEMNARIEIYIYVYFTDDQGHYKNLVRVLVLEIESILYN